MIYELEKRILQKWDSICPNLNRPKELSFYFLEKNLNKGVGWVFDRKRPVAFLKFTTDASVDYNISREYEHLSYLKNKISQPLTQTIPTPYIIDSTNSRLFLVTSFHIGEEMEYNLLLCKKRHKRVEERLFKTFEWLRQFQELTTVSSISINIHDPICKLGRVFHRFRASFDLSVEEESYLDRLKNELAEWTGLSLPLVTSHGDFAPTNILWDRENLIVVDWAEMERQNLPFFDLFSFISGFKLVNRPNGRWDDFVMPTLSFVYFQENWFSGIVREILLNYFSKIGLSLKWTRALFALFLMEKALLDIDHNYSKRIGSQNWKKQFEYLANNYSIFKITPDSIV